MWDPRTLRNERRWRSDGPWLPIEFARTSNLNAGNDKRPYLSLVLHPNAGLIRTYWDMSMLTDSDEARRDLRKRERCNLSDIASLPRHGQTWSSAAPSLEGRIQQWLDSKENDVDAVIWTNLDWKFLGATRFTVEEGMRWLRGLREARRDDTAQEYIRRAPSQTDTCLRRQVREEFGWSDIAIGY